MLITLNIKHQGYIIPNGVITAKLLQAFAK